MKKLRGWILVLGLVLMTAGGVKAQDQPQPVKDESFEAKIVSILEDGEVEVDGARQTYQKLELVVLSGENKGKTMTVENGNLALANVVRYKENDKLVIEVQRNEGG